MTEFKIGDQVEVIEHPEVWGPTGEGTIRYILSRGHINLHVLYAVEFYRLNGRWATHNCEHEGRLYVMSGQGWWCRVESLRPMGATGTFHRAVSDYLRKELC